MQIKTPFIRPRQREQRIHQIGHPRDLLQRFLHRDFFLVARGVW